MTVALTASTTGLTACAAMLARLGAWLRLGERADASPRTALFSAGAGLSGGLALALLIGGLGTAPPPSVDCYADAGSQALWG